MAIQATSNIRIDGKNLILATNNYQNYQKKYIEESCGYASNIFVNRWSGKGANTKLHNHEFYELAVITAGRCGYIYDDQEYEVAAGDALIIPPGRYHQFHDQRGLEIINFIWCPEALCIGLQHLREMQFFRGFFEEEKDARNIFLFENHLVLTNEQLAEIERIHSRMLHEQEIMRECGQLRMNCMLFEMLILLGRYYDKTDSCSCEGDLFRMEKVAEFMEKNFACHIQREDAAAVFGRSVRVFSDAFNKNFGMSFSDYLNKIRLRHARQMLIDTHLRVIDIALECGFCNNNYFCAVFKKVYGITPQKYRREHA